MIYTEKNISNKQFLQTALSGVEMAGEEMYAPQEAVELFEVCRPL